MAKSSKQEIEIVRKAVADLSIHFDNIQVFANRYDPTTESTVAIAIGDGNKFAILGHVDSWRDDVANEDDECDCGRCGCDGEDVEAVDDDEDESLGNR